MGGAYVRRRRSCPECGKTFSTYEIDGGIWGTVKKWALGSRLPALEKKHKLNRRNAKIVAMIKAGHQYKDIGKQFGIAKTTVSHIARQAGIPSRKRPKIATPWSGLV
jgi:transcriptional regulator NrdR family protein